jgi:hypothetical protein
VAFRSEHSMRLNLLIHQEGNVLCKKIMSSSMIRKIASFPLPVSAGYEKSQYRVTFFIY